MGARAVGPWVGEQKPLGKTPLRGNPSPESTYLPTSVVLCCLVVLCCCVLLSFCGAVCACFALMWPVVPCCVVLLVVCAVLCQVVVSVCCGALSLRAGTHKNIDYDPVLPRARLLVVESRP